LGVIEEVEIKEIYLTVSDRGGIDHSETRYLVRDKFFAAFIICISLTLIDSFLIFLPAEIVSALSYISASSHFSSIARGIIDTRDLLYFASLTVFFFYLTVIVQQNERK